MRHNENRLLEILSIAPDVTNNSRTGSLLGGFLLLLFFTTAFSSMFLPTLRPYAMYSLALLSPVPFLLRSRPRRKRVQLGLTWLVFDFVNGARWDAKLCWSVCISTISRIDLPSIADSQFGHICTITDNQENKYQFDTSGFSAADLSVIFTKLKERGVPLYRDGGIAM
ncbi:hypothetical protein [Chitinimonas sp.]|uniref:hypothetical protein n=1 Tax=Chitinimonas sp. TaxID=1934313 RepID=UPI0035B4005A